MFSNEVYRKLLHLSNIWILVVYSIYGRGVLEKSLLLAVVVSIAFELCRLSHGKYKALCETWLTKLKLNLIMRDDELTNFSSATKLLIIAYIMLHIIDQNLYLVGFTTLITADALAALVGKKYGQTKVNNKSLEGSIAFLLTAIMVGFFWWWHLDESYSYLFVTIVAAGMATLAELYSEQINVDDNVLIPSVYLLTAWIYQAISIVHVKPW